MLLSERELSARKDDEITQLKQQYQTILEQFRAEQQKQFGKSSETPQDEQEKISFTRNKPKRHLLPKDLPRETIVYDISEEDKICDSCGHKLHKMGEDKSEQLGFIPAQMFDQAFLRELIHSPWRIVYRRDPQRVRIVRVWHSERLRNLPAAGGKGLLSS